MPAASREEHFRGLIEHAPDILVVLNAEGRYTYVSPSFTRILGYAVEEVVGTSPLEAIHPDDVEGTAAKLAWLAHRPGMVVRHRYRYRHRAGGWRVVESTGSNLLSDPRIAGLVVNSRDVTEQVLAEEALRDSADRMRQMEKMEAIGRLAGGVAHDFNNLLTVIGGNAELALAAGGEVDGVRQELEEIREASRRAAELTGQLLTFSRKQVLRPRRMDLNDVVREMAPILGRLLGGGIRMETRLEPGGARVFADPTQMSQVLMNLVVNARDAMPAGGLLRIETRAPAEGAGEETACFQVAGGRTVLLTVSDSGTGIPAEVRGHIFEPFFTTKGVGEGTGVGLATVYGIVKQSGGNIQVLSEVGEGSEFRICLPGVGEAE